MTDANKNIGQLMDGSGNIVAKYEYSPFGKITAQSGAYADANPFRFSSEYFDVETELVYYNYRYYNVESGRWLSRDPIEETGGLNLYGFIDNDPLNKWDRLGLNEWDPEKEYRNELAQNARDAEPPANDLAANLWKGYIGGSLAALNSRIRSAIDAIRKLLKRKKSDPCSCKKVDNDKIQRDIDALEEANRQDRIMLENGRNQSARALDNGITPNPHGLGKEVNQDLPNIIRWREGEINRLRDILQK